jgi:Ca2+/Na+ antiporter
MTDFITQNSEGSSKVFLYGLGLIVILGSIVLVLYTSKHSEVIQTQDSQNRMKQLDEVLTSHMGRSWPYVLLVFSILIIVILMILFGSANTDYSIYMNDQIAKRIKFIFSIAVILLTAILVFLGAKMYYQNSQVETGGDIPNYIPGQESNEKTKETLEIVGLVIVVVVASAFIFTNIFKKKT